ncbi:MAG: cyclodeaminase/cyclohydrolase family protein [Candidatus Omnitrophica bacterium]|nr:cyclodeaminase/cyclohydrolase family protein [Candidatus Omnitrophota bacterium]
MYKDESLKKYLDDLAAKLPAPGGGSAAAFNAALGTGLISMVINFTLGKPKYAEYEEELTVLLEKSERLRAEFLKLVDLDVTAYKSKDLKECLNVPLLVCRLCQEAIELCPGLITKGNINLISDVACAAILLEAAFAAALFNVGINLKFIGDKELTASLRKELSIKEEAIKKIRMDTEEKVGKIIRG